MNIITGASKVVQGAGQTQIATVLLEFGDDDGSEQKQERERSIKGVVHDVAPSRENVPSPQMTHALAGSLS